MSLAKDFRDYLTTNGFSNVYYGDIPTSPDECVGVFEYAGQQADIYGLDRPGLQVRVRGEPGDYEDARQVAQDIADLLIKIGNEYTEENPNGVTINGTVYLRVFPALGVTPMGRDKNDRIEFVQNFYVTKGR